MTMARTESEFDQMRKAVPKSLTMSKFRACREAGRSKVITRMDLRVSKRRNSDSGSFDGEFA